MADWLKRVVDEVDRQYKDLPEWKRNPEQIWTQKTEEEPKSSAIREPRQD